MNKIFTKINILLICILAINLFLRVPSLFDPVSYGDECIYLSLGHSFNHGLVFYRDLHDNKPPLLYLVSALAQAKLFWLRLIMILCNLFNVYLIFRLAKKLLNNSLAGCLSAFLFVIFSLLPEGRIANGEIFMIMPATAGVLVAILAFERKKNFWFLLSGLLFSVAFLFKVPIFFDFIGFLIALFIIPKFKKLKSCPLLIKDKKLLLILLGFSAPIILSIIYYALNGAFVPYVRSALLQNIGYLSSWGASKIGLFYRAVIVVGLTLLIFKYYKKIGFAFALFSLMTLFGLYGVFLTQRPYPHYLLEISPWFSLLLAILIFQKKVWQFIIALILISLTISGVKLYKFWWYQNLAYYQNFVNFSLGKINQNTFFRFFGENTLNNYKIAKYIKTRTQPNDRVFIWGDGACIYSLANRLPVGRFLVNYHIYDFSGFQETLTAIHNKQPKIIVELEPIDPKFGQLNALLTTNYVKVAKIGKAVIYQNLFPHAQN